MLLQPPPAELSAVARATRTVARTSPHALALTRTHSHTPNALTHVVLSCSGSRTLTSIELHKSPRISVEWQTCGSSIHGPGRCTVVVGSPGPCAPAAPRHRGRKAQACRPRQIGSCPHALHTLACICSCILSDMAAAGMGRLGPTSRTLVDRRLACASRHYTWC